MTDSTTPSTTVANPIRVVTVDDHAIFRGGIQFLLLAFDDIVLVGQAHNGEEAVQLCEQTQPDVILMDLKMVGMDGVAATRAIKQACPQTQIIALTSFYEPDLVQRALQAGAISYLIKDVSIDDLAAAIRAAHAGRPTFATEATQALINAVDAPAPKLGHDLTERQLEILRLLVGGLSNNEIARQLELSPHTVRNHVSEILAKLGATNRAEAAALAVRYGVIGAERARGDGAVEQG